MNILHLTIDHSPFDDRIFYKEATAIAESHRVLVLAYSSSGLLKTMGNEDRDPGIYNEVVVDSFGKCSFSVKVLRRLGFVRFPLGEVIENLKRHDFCPDIIHCHEISSLKLAINLKNYFGTKLVFDVHEFFLGYCFDKHSKGIFTDLSFAKRRRIYKKLLQHVDVTINVNNFIRAINVVFNPKAKHVLIPNAFILPPFKEADKNTDKFILVHEGTLNFGRGLEDLVAIFEDDWIRSNCLLKIVGELRGPEKKYFQALTARRPHLKESILITGWIDYEKLHLHINGDIGMITMKPRVNNMLAGAPNKLFNYVWAGMPICTYDIPASSDLVKRYNIGVISPRTRDDLIYSIKNLCNNLDYYRSNVIACRDNFSFAHFINELKSAYL